MFIFCCDKIKIDKNNKNGVFVKMITDFKLNSFYCSDFDIDKNINDILDVSSYSDNMKITIDEIEQIKERYNIETVYYGYILWSDLESTSKVNAEYLSFKIPYFEKDGKLYAPMKIHNEWFLFEESMYGNSEIFDSVLKWGCGKIYTSLNEENMYECIAMTFSTDEKISISKLEKSFVQCVLTRLGNIGDLIKRNL